MAGRMKSGLILVGLMGIAWTACNTADSDATASQSSGGSETAVAVDATNQIGVVAYNVGGASAPGQFNGWTVLNDGGEHSEATSPWVTAAQAPLLSDGSPYMGGRGDPSLIWTGWSNQFAYVTLAESVASFNGTDGPAWKPDNAIDVVVAVSNDGGQTFGPASGTGNFDVVSNPQSSGIDTSGGFVDQAVIVAEQPSTHVAWVTWDNINVPFNGSGKRSWIRRLHFNQNGTIDKGPVTEVRIDCNLSCVKFDNQNIGAYCDPAHALDNCKNGDGVSGTETELIAFPRVNNSPFSDTALINNQGLLTCSDKLDVQWRVSISQDGGNTWKQGVGQSDGSSMLAEEPLWPNCIVPAAMANAGNNRGRMPVVHDEDTMQWHVYWTKEVSGQRVFHSVFPDSFSGIASEEVDPVFALPGQSAPCPGGQECGINQFMPTASWSPATPQTPDTHAVVWHDTRFDANTPLGVMWGSFSHSGGALGSFSNTEVDQAGAPWPFTGTNGNTPWGDYEGMASDRNGNFVPAWGDNRLQGTQATNTHVWWRVWGP
jgi:hypothetical protein